MDRRTLLALAAAAPLTARAAVPTPAIQERGPTRPRYAEALARLSTYVAEHRRVHNLPAFTLVVTDAEGWVAALDSGPADPATGTPLRPGCLFQIGSITKSFLCIALWRAAETGRLDLAADARSLLPDAPWPDAPIRVRNLMEHSSGLPEDAPVFPRGGDGRLWSGYAPGSHWSYSNTGYHLLGLMLERLHGRPLRAVLETEALRPLGMATARGAIVAADRALYPASFTPYRDDVPYPTGGPLGPAAWVDVVEGAGCIAAPSREMALYLRWLIGAANGRGGGVLPDAAARAFTTPTIDAPGWAEHARYGYGLATLQDEGRSLLHHTGGMVSFSSSLHVDAAAGVGAFASTAVGETGYRPRAATLYACRLLRAAREGSPWPEPPPVRPPGALPKGLDEIYAGPGGTLAVAGEKITLGGVAGRIEPAGENLLAVHPALERYVLKPELQGERVVGLWSGADWYGAPGAVPPPAAPERLRALEGRYDNDDPWQGGPARVVARPDGLWLGGTEKLTALPDGSWRIGADDWSPERARFDAPLGGRPQRLNLSGVDFVRRAEGPIGS